MVAGKLDAVIWKEAFGHIAPVSGRVAEPRGVAIRCRVVVDFYPPAGASIIVKEIDPSSRGELARRRSRRCAACRGGLSISIAGCLPSCCLIALITSHGSAAYHDFWRRSGERLRFPVALSTPPFKESRRSAA
jgi:exonuclease VII large subunit